MRLRQYDDLRLKHPSKIENGTKYHQFFYDGGRKRWKQVYHNGTTNETTLYVGNDFEKRTEGSYEQFRHYIKADGRLVAMVLRATDGITTTAANQSVLTDHLGSMVGILDHNGNPAISESFAAYGTRRDTTDWQGPIANEPAIAALTQRGFTGQTHLDATSLIHFGGRVLDAQFGRFLSADPFVPDPGSTQSFNRYSYLENDPLSGTDPSGFIGIDLGGFADNFNVSVSWRFGRRYTYQAPQTGCMTANAIGCFGPAPVKSVLDMIVDKVIGPLPSYQRADDLVMYFTPPDCPLFSGCASDDTDDDDDGGWGWKDVFGTIVDFTPIIGDAKGIWEAIEDPTPVNIIAAGVGLAGPWGDAAAKGLKAAAKAKELLQNDATSNGITTLYRAVGPDELADIENTGQLINRGQAEGKYFTSSAEDASDYAKQAVNAFGDPPYTIVRTQIPTASLPTPASVDGGIPAYVIPDDALPGLAPQILDSMPIPKR